MFAFYRYIIIIKRPKPDRIGICGPFSSSIFNIFFFVSPGFLLLPIFQFFYPISQFRSAISQLTRSQLIDCDDGLIQSFPLSSSEEEEQRRSAGKRSADQSAEEKPADRGGQSDRIVACLTTTYLFAKIRPQLLVKHVQTLQPYLNIKCFVQVGKLIKK
jgi:hypothetical protein